MSNRDDFMYLGWHWVENDDSDDYGPEVITYDIYRPLPGIDGEEHVATARREEIDPDGPPRWGIRMDSTDATVWFRSRIDAANHVREALGL